MTSIYSPQLFSKLSNEWYLATALYDAVDDGNLREVAILLQEKHADPNVVIPDYDITPFHLAVGHENEQFAKDVTKLLLKNGGDPNVKDNEGVTPLHVAAVWNRSAVVRILLSYGGDPMIVDDAEKNAFHYAYEEHAWETLKTLEIHRRATKSKERDAEKSYSIHLDKVIIQGDGVQAEYKALCDGCKKEIISTQSVATQTPLPHVKLSESNGGNDEDVHFDVENISSDVIRPKLFDWCEQACSAILTDDCKRKITSHRTNGRVYEYNPIFDRQTFAKCEPSNDFKKLMCCSTVDDADKGLDKNIQTETIEMKPESKTTPNGDSSEDSLTYPQSGKLFFDEIHIPFIDESTESSRNCDKAEPEDIIRGKIEEEPGELKSNAKHVSWSGCLSTCACIPRRLNESESSVYFTNPESDEEKSKTEQSLRLSGINELSRQTEQSQVDKSLVTNDDVGVSFVKVDHSLITNDESMITNVSATKRSLNISFEYKYTDDEDGIEFVEAKLPLYTSVPHSTASTPVKLTTTKDHVEESISEISDGTAYDTDYIRTELKKLGFVSGPIAGATKKLYLKKLRRIRKCVPDFEESIMKPSKFLSPDLEHVLREDNYDWERIVTKWSNLEKEIMMHFSNYSFSSSWRSGTAKTSFTYLLLDPRITNNLPARCEQMDLGDVWRDFVHSIFYIGKGTRARPYEHLHEAFLIWRETKSYPRRRCNLKVQHILDIWKEGHGVVCVQTFHNIIPAEAYTREAAMIDAIGLSRLKNEKAGMYYGIAASWNAKLKRRLGVYLLYRAMRMFIADNEVQLKPTDVG